MDADENSRTLDLPSSRHPDLNRGPTDYEGVASHTGNRLNPGIQRTLADSGGQARTKPPTKSPQGASRLYLGRALDRQEVRHG